MLDGDPDAVNTYERAVKWSALSAAWFDTQNPPTPASVFENVPTMKSTVSSTPWASAQPSPLAPYAPNECASSTRRNAPAARHTAAMSARGATSPPIEYNP